MIHVGSVGCRPFLGLASFSSFFLFSGVGIVQAFMYPKTLGKIKTYVLMRARFVFEVCICLSLLMQLLDDYLGG